MNVYKCVNVNYLNFQEKESNVKPNKGLHKMYNSNQNKKLRRNYITVLYCLSNHECYICLEMTMVFALIIRCAYINTKWCI